MEVENQGRSPKQMRNNYKAFGITLVIGLILMLTSIIYTTLT